MKIATWMLGGIAVTACGGSSPEHGNVTVKTGLPPALVAFRDEMHTAWQSVAVDGGNAFELAITGSYQVAVVCQSGGEGSSFDATIYSRTLDDGDAFQATCLSVEFQQFHVRGQRGLECGEHPPADPGLLAVVELGVVARRLGSQDDRFAARCTTSTWELSTGRSSNLASRGLA
jgi:hypothetical protein